MMNLLVACLADALQVVIIVRYPLEQQRVGHIPYRYFVVNLLGGSDDARMQTDLAKRIIRQLQGTQPLPAGGGVYLHPLFAFVVIA